MKRLLTTQCCSFEAVEELRVTSLHAQIAEIVLVPVEKIVATAFKEYCNKKITECDQPTSIEITDSYCMAKLCQSFSLTVLSNCFTELLVFGSLRKSLPIITL